MITKLGKDILKTTLFDTGKNLIGNIDFYFKRFEPELGTTF